MAATEDDIIRDEQERSNLLRAIADVETVITVSTPGTRRVLENTLENAKKRVVTLDRKIEQAKVEHAVEVQAQATAAAALAAREAELSAEEKATYRGFLEESYFTKKDFGKLERFYSHSWDRLSDNGKEEMSKRIDEGIRRKEFKFDELPKVVQEKESAYRAAKKEKAQPAIHEKSSGLPTEAKPVAKTPETSAVKDIDLASIDLGGATLADCSSAPSTASIPCGSDTKTIRHLS